MSSKPSISELINQAGSKEVSAEWDRRQELLVRFNGLSKSTLNSYLNEMEEIPEFKAGLIKPTHSVTWVNLETFIWYLRWKEANRYLSRKLKPTEVSK